MTNIVQSSDDVLSINALTSYVRQSIKTIIEKEGFKSYKVEVKDVSTNGGNYLASLQAVSITGKADEGENKTLHLFLKNIVPMSESAAIDLAQVYVREGYVYNVLFKMIEKVEDNYNIPQEDRFNSAKQYGAINDKVIILEDMSKMGFNTYDRVEVIPIRFAELAIEQLAKFHALPFAIQKDYPKYFEEEIKNLKPLFKAGNEDFRGYMRKSCDKAMETLGDDVKTRLDLFFPKLLDNFENYFQVPTHKAISLIHGDFRPNNILVKEIDGEVKKVIPVDYQVTHFGYPILDFIYFIFVSSDRRFRTEHLQNLKDLYYSTFENFLSKFNIEAKYVYSRKQFEQEYTDKLDYGLASFLLVMPFLFSKDNAIPDVANRLLETPFDMNDSYKDRLHEIVEDFMEWGYF